MRSGKSQANCFWRHIPHVRHQRYFGQCPEPPDPTIRCVPWEIEGFFVKLETFRTSAMASYCPGTEMKCMRTSHPRHVKEAVCTNVAVNLDKCSGQSGSLSIADSKDYHDHLIWRHPHESVEHSTQVACYRSKITLVSYYEAQRKQRSCKSTEANKYP